MPTGSYIVKLIGPSSGILQLWGDQWTGLLTWYSDNTNDTSSDEISLYSAGHARNGMMLYLQTLRHSSGILTLQIKASISNTQSANYQFYFYKVDNE